MLPIIAQSLALFLTLSSMYCHWKDVPKVDNEETGRDRDCCQVSLSGAVAQSHSNEIDATIEL